MSRVLVYASDPAVRERVRLAIGRTPDRELGRLDYVDAGDEEAVLAAVDAGDVDLCLLDGEAWPTGGLGISRQIKNEIRDAPATVVLVARHDDRWLGKWSQADAVVQHPVDPVELTGIVVQLLRDRTSRAPVETPKARFGMFRR